MQFEITVHATVRYTAVGEHYPTTDPVEMLKIDIDNYRDHPNEVFMDSDLEVSVDGKILED